MIEAVNCVKDKLKAVDVETKSRFRGAVNVLAARVQAAQERLDASLESLKQEHERFVAEIQADEAADVNEEACDDDVRLYAGQRGMLPWVVDGVPVEPLKRAVLDVSSTEESFRSGAADAYVVCVKHRKALIFDLLALDPNLKAMHSKLSPLLREDVFWTNYFYRCADLRRRYKAQQPSIDALAADLDAAIASDDSAGDGDDDDDDSDGCLSVPDDDVPDGRPSVLDDDDDIPDGYPSVPDDDDDIFDGHPSVPDGDDDRVSDCVTQELDESDDLDSWLDDDDFRATTAQLARDGLDYEHLSDSLLRASDGLLRAY